MFAVMFELWGFNLSRNRLHDAIKLAEKILNLSRLVNSEVAEAGAHSAFGSTCLWRGEFGLARQHLEQAIAIYDRDIARYLPMHEALVVPSRCHMSWTLWMTGYPDQAYARAEEALELATRLGRPFSMAFALMYAIALAHFRGDYTTIRPRAESLIEIARENGFPYWSAVGSMVIGRVLVGEGNHDAGIVRMLDAMRTLRETGGELIYSYALNLLAESYLKGRQPEKGLAVVAEALKGSETSGQRIHEAELWRLRGELLVLRSDAQAEAEGSFQHAMELAVHQEALSLELRATTSLARFLGRHGRPDEAKARLVSVVARINEGIEDADFKEAAALLGELG
jgi:predicted ATPase